MRKNWKGAAAVFAALATLALLLAACSPRTPPASNSSSGSTSTAPAQKGPIVVGSKIDGEGALLGQVILQTLQANGFQVVDKTRTGATDVVRKALVDGQIDMYPEYTGNGPNFHPGVTIDPKVMQNAATAYETAKSLDASDGIIWLQPAPANNTWAVALPKDFATKNNLKTLADLAAYVNKGGAFKIVGSQEYFTKPTAFPAFEKAYGFKLKPSQEIALATGDTAVTEKAAAQGSQGANAAMAYGTDGTISALDLVVLEDPKGVQPVYQPAPIVRKAIADKYPELATILDPVFAKLDFTTLQGLNKQVGVDGKPAKDVAAEWLKAQGVIK